MTTVKLFFNALSPAYADNLENVKNFNWKNIFLFPWALVTAAPAVTLP